MKKLIPSLIPFLNGLPRFARNDGGGVNGCHRKLSIQAFSLIELLISLIIISLITAVFAPILTVKLKRGEIALGQVGVVSYNSKVFNETTEWEIPARVRKIKVTSIAGGGGGGGAIFKAKEITTTEHNWIVPSGVTKLKVYMVGGGASGASSGQNTPGGTRVEYQNIAQNSSWKDFLTAGTHYFQPTPVTYTAPALKSGCTGNWSVIPTGATVAPGANYIYTPQISNVNIYRVIGCGGGGAGGGRYHTTANGSAGGSGGYLDKNVDINGAYFKTVVAGGGTCGQFHFEYAGATGGAGSGGFGVHYGANGTIGNSNQPSGNGAWTDGSGGGGSTGVYNNNSLVLEIPGGGGAAGLIEVSTNQSGCATSGSGGAGGGANSGQGGNAITVCAQGGTSFGFSAGSGGCGGSCGASGALERLDSDNFRVYFNGGSGGGGIGGIGGSGIGGTVAGSIFPSSNCSGGSKAQAGSPGALRAYYKINEISNGLSCSSILPPVAGQAGGGGGAGEVWVGEISVTPGQKINFDIGEGGLKQTTAGSDGNPGGTTSISVNGSVVAFVNGGQGGKKTGAGGGGGGIKKSNFSSSAKYVNWLNLPASFVSNGANSSGASGGNGGGTYNKDNSSILGAFGGSNGTNGADAVNYGTGGGGGGSSTTSWGQGGKGARGYIYIVYSNASGGGGASGEIVQVPSISTIPASKVKIVIAKGGRAGEIGQNGGAGENSYIEISSKIYALAKGGSPGLAGTAEGSGKGGNYNNEIKECAKGENGSSDKGGSGGSITPSLCSLFDSTRGLGGCGGRVTYGLCYGASSSAEGKAGFFGGGGGGGGGSVLNNQAYKGGSGADGTIIIEWN